MDHDHADVTMPTLAEMERCATILPEPQRMALQFGAAVSQLGILGLVPTSPHDARLASLEADLARLLAENVRLAASNAVLQRGMQIIAASDVPEPAKAGIPARALGCHAQRIGLLTGIW